MGKLEKIVLFLVFMVPYTYLVVELEGSATAARAEAREIQQRGMAGQAIPAGGEAAAKARFEQAVATRLETAAFHKRAVALLNMSLMFWWLYLALGGMIGQALDSGIREVSESLRVAERRSEQAKTELAEAEAKMARIDDDVDALRVRERTAAEVEKARLIEFGAKEASQIAEHAEVTVAREAKAAQEALVSKVAQKAFDEAFAGVEGALDDATRARLQAAMVEGMRAS